MSDPAQHEFQQPARATTSDSSAEGQFQHQLQDLYGNPWAEGGYADNEQQYQPANQTQAQDQRAEGAYTPSQPSVTPGYNAAQQQQYLQGAYQQQQAQAQPQFQPQYANQAAQQQHWFYPVPVLPVPIPSPVTNYPPYSPTQPQVPAFGNPAIPQPPYLQYGNNTLSQASPTSASWSGYHFGHYPSPPRVGQPSGQSLQLGTNNPYTQANASAGPSSYHQPQYSQQNSQPQDQPSDPRSQQSYQNYIIQQRNVARAASYQQSREPQQPSRRPSSSFPQPLPSGQTSLHSYATDLSYYEKPTCTWEQFEVEWAALLRREDAELLKSLAQAQAKVPGAVPFSGFASMAVVGAPVYADVDELCNGLRTAGYRVTVEKLKSVIRGINTSYTTHLRLSGTKAALIDSVTGHLKDLATQRSPEYFRIAKLVGEAQGYTYSYPAGSATNGVNGAAATSSSTVASSSNAAIAPRASTSSLSPYPGHANPHGANGNAGNASASSNNNYSTSGPNPSFLSRPSDFNLDRHSPAASSAHSAYNKQFGNAPYQPSGASTSSSSGITTYPAYSRLAPPPGPASRNGYPSSSSAAQSSSANSNVPTSWPAKLPPKPTGLAGQPAVPMNFKPSPFYRIIAGVSTVATLNKAHPGDRNTATCIVQLTEDQRQKLAAARTSSSNPQYQLRLYCTSIDHYSPNTGFGFNPNSRSGLPIEFPSACEAKLNDCSVTANLKGIKKKPGTTPPACVSAAKFPSGHSRPGNYALKLETTQEFNKVDLNYANTDKLFYMIVYFVEYTSVGQTVERIKENKVRTKEEVIKSLQRQAEDPDLQATSETISLKDPLSFMDMQTPVRGLHCMHIQCFDANIFLSMMETTPTWLCPVCNRAINPDDIVLDAFTQDIKRSIPSSVESVIIETDGTWRSEDNKHGTAKKVLEAKARATESLPPPSAGTNGHARDGSMRATSVSTGGGGQTSKASTPFDLKPDIGGLMNGDAKGKGKAPAEVIDLDDDDDDEATPPPPRMNGGNSSQRPAAAALSTPKTAKSGGVIDLTLSDDDDDDDEVTYRRPASVQNSAAAKRRVDSDWEDGPDGGTSSSSRQRPRWE